MCFIIAWKIWLKYINEHLNYTINQRYDSVQSRNKEEHSFAALESDDDSTSQSA